MKEQRPLERCRLARSIPLAAQLVFLVSTRRERSGVLIVTGDGKILKVDSSLDKVYVSFVGHDKRLDTWVTRRDLITLVDDVAETVAAESSEAVLASTHSSSKKHKTSDVSLTHKLFSRALGTNRGATSERLQRISTCTWQRLAW